MADAPKHEKKPEQAKSAPEATGLGVIIYPLGGGKFRVEQVVVTGGKLESVGLKLGVGNPRSALAQAETLLEEICAARLK